jgi:hypothetical protein
MLRTHRGVLSAFDPLRAEEYSVMKFPLRFNNGLLKLCALDHKTST